MPAPGLLDRTPAADDHPVDIGSIVATPDVCGGAARLVDTRIPVWTLERMRQLGLSDADILRCYPSLDTHGLAAAWSHVESRRAEIERAIRENEAEPT